jgi:ATP-dependent Clp protease protease subunit
MQQVVWLDYQNPEAPIKIYLNSPGGSVSAGLAIYDALNMAKAPIHVFGYGICASMGCVLLSAKYNREDCKRYVLPNCRVMDHQVRGGASGQASDIMIEAKLMSEINDDLMIKLAEFSGRSVEEITKNAARDHWLTAQQAVDYGYADEIYTGK